MNRKRYIRLARALGTMKRIGKKNAQFVSRLQRVSVEIAEMLEEQHENFSVHGFMRRVNFGK